MTPGARVAAAIDILDQILGGAPAEATLTGWARGHRFAGSKDRRAIRDHVYDALRNLRSYAAAGGDSAHMPQSGRAVMLGWARASGADVTELFSGTGYAPQAVGPNEKEIAPSSNGQLMDLPDWLAQVFLDAFGEADAKQQAELLKRRAPVTLRVNIAKASRTDVRKALAAEGIEAFENPLSRTALTTTGEVRGLEQQVAFLGGLFEFQDAASQAVVDRLSLEPGASVLDFCAGGGGKSLAIAAQTQSRVFAHDINTKRMADLPARAARAGANVQVSRSFSELKGKYFDCVLVDAPCSGSGSWRRDPDAKWRLSPEDLDAVIGLQQDVLKDAAGFAKPEGTLAYATCSILPQENRNVADLFVSTHPEWQISNVHLWPISEFGDGFGLTLLKRKP